MRENVNASRFVAENHNREFGCETKYKPDAPASGATEWVYHEGHEGHEGCEQESAEATESTFDHKLCFLCCLLFIVRHILRGLRVLRGCSAHWIYSLARRA